MTKKNVLLNCLKSGKIATVTFIKKDGSERTINGKLFVRKSIKDIDNPCINTVAHIPKYVTLYDLKKEAYRNDMIYYTIS